MNFSDVTKINSVYYFTPENQVFSECYLKVREKERRLFTDAEVEKLPYSKRYEWPLRVKSTTRFTTYLASKNKALTILDIGCGNGWFSNRIAKVSRENSVIGLDINRDELEQAARVFNSNNLNFVYADIYKVSDIFKMQFDIITMNGAIQYFENFEALIKQLQLFLKPKGEIHIIDSPFYKKNRITNAKERTKAYYTTLGVPKMAKNYHHHNLDNIRNFETLYSPNNKLLNKVLNKKDSPFSWYRFIKTNS
ncbi:class I SAM-dependent methyltransferase [Algibacter miyuki]|uniref:Class I SAM-dependent methyltransferase n=1 Tax=Algibacter miyuki TaxID=1306933 RepID=A0ABV5GWQ5_9FLAO|nr:methyltransferase domain-containing protein [Algibacter miyuki]MDN3664295.1 methyltransferase domain-containing protein [Algibacter miyuki]